VPGIGPVCAIPNLIIANNLGFGPIGFLASTPAPWSTTLQGTQGPLEFTVQAIIEQKPGVLRVTNGIAVSILP